MAKSQGNTVSVIGMLARTRAGLFHAADKDGQRSLSNEEWRRLAALNNVIANAPAVSRSDASAQVAVAFEIVELLADEGGAAPELEVAASALRSAVAVLIPHRCAA